MSAGDKHIVIKTESTGIPTKRKGRRGDGGVYLVVADESNEFNVALRYAARMAGNNRGRLGIAHAIDIVAAADLIRQRQHHDVVGGDQ